MSTCTFGYPEIFLISLTFILLCLWKIKTTKNNSLPTNWPLVGMLPAILQNNHWIHCYLTDILTETGGTFDFKCPSYLNMDMLITCDPANINHIFTKNFSNYPKGPKFRKYLEIIGDGIINVDFEMWEFQRRTTLSFMALSNFNTLLGETVWEKVEDGLLPVLESFSQQGADFDLQDILQRFTFDTICKIILDYDPRSLCTELPHVKCEKAFNDMMEALLYRHVLPERVWKLQKWLGIGMERKLAQAWKSFDEFIYPCVDASRVVDVAREKDIGHFNMLQTFRKAYEEKIATSSDSSRKFLRDTALSLLLAGRDTMSTCLTRLFWLVATNPLKETMILEEIETQLHLKEEGRSGQFFNAEESKKLIYLHAALCESLRLFPPVGLEHKSPVRPDYLPSGNDVKENAKIIVSFYSVGRMESVWGKDCLEFKPERWILPGGGIKHEPAYKFPAFNVGPRMCVGKEMSFIQMKMIAATVLYRFNVRLVEGHPVCPRGSTILQARDGLRVRLSKRID